MLNKPKASSALIFFMLLSYSILVVFPLFWLSYTSLKSDHDIFLHPFKLPDIRHLQWNNFSAAWTRGMFDRYFLNSVILTITTVGVTLFLSAMAAYALARFKFLGSRAIYFYFLAGLMIPLQLAIVPLFFEMRAMHLLNSLRGLFLAYLAFGFPFSIFVLTGFFESLSLSLHELPF